MTTQELKEYLKDVYELEKQKYTYQQIAQLYENTMDELQSSTHVLKENELHRGDEQVNANSWTLVSPASIKNLNYYTFDDLWPIVAHVCTDDGELRKKLGDTITKKTSSSFTIATRVFIVTFIISILRGIIKGSLFSAIIGGGIISLIIAGIVFLALSELTHIDYIKKDSKTYNYIIDEYTKWYNTELERKKKRIAPKLELLKTEYITDVVDNLNATSNLLEEIYAKNIIHKKYQTFVTVAQIYEYFDTGRCTELEGPNGAYNLFESELRLNIIITQLDRIIAQLDRLNSYMSMMVSAINQTNITLGRISNQLSNIEANSALIAYNSEVTAFNMELMRRYR